MDAALCESSWRHVQARQPLFRRIVSCLQAGSPRVALRELDRNAAWTGGIVRKISLGSDMYAVLSAPDGDFTCSKKVLAVHGGPNVDGAASRASLRPAIQRRCLALLRYLSADAEACAVLVASGTGARLGASLRLLEALLREERLDLPSVVRALQECWMEAADTCHLPLGEEALAVARIAEEAERLLLDFEVPELLYDAANAASLLASDSATASASPLGGAEALSVTIDVELATSAAAAPALRRWAWADLGVIDADGADATPRERCRVETRAGALGGVARRRVRHSDGKGSARLLGAISNLMIGGGAPTGPSEYRLALWVRADWPLLHVAPLDVLSARIELVIWQRAC